VKASRALLSAVTGGRRAASEAAFDALAPDFQFRADTVTMSGNNVATIPNRRGGDALVMAAGTLAAPAGDARFNGAPSLLFTGTQWLDSNLAPSAWAFGHDGSGFEAHCVMVESNANSDITVCSTCGPTLGAKGFRLRVYAMAPWFLAGTGAALVVNVGNGFLGYDTPAFVHGATLKNGAPIPASVFLNAQTLAANLGTAPVAGAPDATLRLGATAAGASPASMRFAELAIWRRVLHEWERQQWREYVQARYGIAAPVVTGIDRELLSLKPYSWIRADYYATAGGKVTSMLDKAMPGHSLSQASAASQVPNPTPSAEFNNQPAFAFNGSTALYASTLPKSGWSLLSDGSGSEIHVLYKIAALTDPTKTLFATGGWYGGSGKQFIPRSSSGGICNDVIYGAGGILAVNQNVFPATLAPEHIAISLSLADTPDYRAYRGGVQMRGVNAASALDSGAPEFSLNLGALIAGAFYFAGLVPELLFFARVLSAADLLRVKAYYLERYGIAG
jgi:hypothetical protein